jgi:hypothetical protein
LIVGENIDETGVAFDESGNKIKDARKHSVKLIGGGDAAADLVQNIYVEIVNRRGRVHGRTLSDALFRCPIAIFDGKDKKVAGENLMQINETDGRNPLDRERKSSDSFQRAALVRASLLPISPG